MSETGQNAKYSVRADIFRFALELGHCAKQRALPIWANNGLPSVQQAFVRKRCVGQIMAPGMKQRMSIRNGLPSVHS